MIRMGFRRLYLRSSPWRLLTLLVALCWPILSSAEIYRWSDESGTFHFTQDLKEVPPRFRAAALASAQGRAQIQTYSKSSNPAAVSPETTAGPPRHRPGSYGTMRIPFQRQGTLMRVDVKLNNHVTAPFYVDTGASGLSIPYSVAQQLGIRITESTPRKRAMTANGPISQPVVKLRSVELGPASVNNLEALVSGSMDIGLLGGSFFNNFVYQIDAAEGVILLRPNGAVASGLTQEQWRARFSKIRSPLRRLEAALDSGAFSDPERVRELELKRHELRANLEDLEAEATRSEVPHAWRQ